jgi:hypothetical protein
MIAHLAQAGEGGGCTPTLFHCIYKFVVYAPAERTLNAIISFGETLSNTDSQVPQLSEKLKCCIYSPYFYSTCTLWVSQMQREGEGAIGENMYSAQIQSPLTGASFKVGFQLALTP